MRLHSLKSIFWMLFSAFAILVVFVSGASFYGLNLQKQNGLMIDQLEQHRKLLRQIETRIDQYVGTFDEAEVAQGRLAAGTNNQLLMEQSKAELLDAVQLFYQNVSGDHLSGTAHELVSQISRLVNLTPRDFEFNTVASRANDVIGNLDEQIDRVLSEIVTRSAKQLDQQRRMLVVGLVLTGLMLFAGVWLLYQNVLIPLYETNRQARAFARGNLKQPLQVEGIKEVAAVGAAIEDMRREMLRWHDTLETKVAQRTAELEAFTAVSQEIIANLQLDHVLQSITDNTRQLLGCETAFLCLYDKEQDVMALGSASCGASLGDAPGMPAVQGEDLDRSEVVFNPDNARGFVHPVLLRCDIARCFSVSEKTTPASTFPANQALQGRSVNSSLSEDQQVERCKILDNSFQTSHLSAPLFLNEKVIGALCVGSSQKNYFSQDDRRALARLAGVASLALQNARLFQQVESLAVLEERQRVAAEIHDGFVQTVTTLRLLQEQLESALSGAQADETSFPDILERMRRASLQAEQEARKAIASFYEELPLSKMLQDQLEQLAEEMSLPGQPVGFVSRVPLPMLLSWQTTEQVLRITHEAVANANKHAGAKRIQISLDWVEPNALLQIQDDGMGFQLDGPLDDEDRAHYGLKVMEVRAERIGAKLEINSQPGEGTRVSLWVPVEAWSQPGEANEKTSVVS